MFVEVDANGCVTITAKRLFDLTECERILAALKAFGMEDNWVDYADAMDSLRDDEI
jgi:hypothetical protein